MNTRFKRCAQVIAMDGRYAGFAGAKTGHGGPAFRGRGVLRHIRRAGLVALAAFSRRHLCTVCAVGGEDSVEPSEVDPGFGHQGDESCNDVQDALMSREAGCRE